MSAESAIDLLCSILRSADVVSPDGVKAIRGELQDKCEFDHAAFMAAQSQYDELRKQCEELIDEARRARLEAQGYLAQLLLFWKAERRPWFCPACHDADSGRVDGDKRGHLQPFGRYGLKCADCSTEYAPVNSKPSRAA